VLGCFLLEGDGIILRITGTDLETQLSASCAVDPHEPFSICLPRRFLDIVRAFPADKPIVMLSDEEKMLVKCGRSRFTLQTMPSMDYPSLSAVEATTVIPFDQAELKELIHCCSYAMAAKDVRYYLNGVMVEVTPSGVNFVATDGHRLGVMDSPFDSGESESKQYILPSNAVGEMLRLLKKGDCELSFNENHCSLTMDSLTFISKLIAGTFPDYRRVLPRESSTIVQLPRLAFMEALKRVALVLDDKTLGIELNFSDDGLCLKSSYQEQESEEWVECEKTGNALTIGFNPHYVMDVLGIMTGDQVKVCLTDSTSAMRIEGVEVIEGVHTIMSMRL
jgi:DNA polymerase-3 subunit beta